MPAAKSSGGGKISQVLDLTAKGPGYSIKSIVGEQPKTDKPPGLSLPTTVVRNRASKGRGSQKESGKK